MNRITAYSADRARALSKAQPKPMFKAATAGWVDALGNPVA